MPTSQLPPFLNLVTLIVVVLIAAVGYALFLRKRSNRHPVEKPNLAAQSMAPKKDKSSD